MVARSLCLLGGFRVKRALVEPVNNGAVTLTWSATEGGTYTVQSTTNFSTWTTQSTNAAAILNSASYTSNAADNYNFYRVARTALANYDAVSSGGGAATYAVPGSGGVSRGSGTNITLSITLPGTPPSPPANAPITSVTLGATTATSSSYAVQGTVLANFHIATTNALGTQNVVVTFTSGPPPYTFSSAFTINP